MLYRRFFLRCVHPFIPYIVSYDQGWQDGWNSCRMEAPDKREFMTRAKMRKRYGYIPDGTFIQPDEGTLKDMRS
jgi:hypothetical protein